jgi:aminoglycoside phosphotransferase (APT) family kinase protein
MFYAKTDIAVPDSALRRLASENPKAARERTGTIERLLRTSVGNPRSVEPLARQGTFHLVHRAELDDGRRIVVRSSLPDIWPIDETLYAEQALYPVLSAHGIDCPRIHAVSVGDRRCAPFDFIVMDEVRGTPLSDLPDSEQDDAGILRRVGRAVRRIHDVTGRGFGPLVLPATGDVLSGRRPSWRHHVQVRLAAHIDACVDTALISSIEAGEVHRLFRECPVAEHPVPRLLHADLGGHNIFLHENRVAAIIDWEDAMLGDPLFDVAMWMTFQPQRRHDAFLQGYGLARGNLCVDRTLAILYLRIMIAKAVHRTRFAYADRPGRPTLRQRLATALAQASSVDAASCGQRDVDGRNIARTNVSDE